ncbi:MAG TPA: hypothetical protein VMD30_11870 [Tepidisphaeraceae bacterium]|nr:hypothetical protein [Tepidisphaeraceae bacterium]
MIQVRCKCGFKATVADALAGKTLRCPKCNERIAVSTSTVAPNPKAKKFQSRSSSVSISRGQIMAVVIVAALVIAGAIFYFGPVSTWRQWNQLQPTASNQVQDVVLFGLEAYLSQRDLYDPAFEHNSPQINGPVNFFPPLLEMSMPDKIGFVGTTSQGSFSGNYYVKTGEVEATVYYGGYTVAGMATVKASTGSFQMTGREINGVPQAESNGVSLHIISHPRPYEE